ncbi:MAG: hypothetical protein FWD32_00380 [Firmicutes bacterium]|nr:hypothetical protein [Bacillota bacterium]
MKNHKRSKRLTFLIVALTFLLSSFIYPATILSANEMITGTGAKGSMVSDNLNYKLTKTVYDVNTPIRLDRNPTAGYKAFLYRNGVSAGEITTAGGYTFNSNDANANFTLRIIKTDGGALIHSQVITVRDVKYTMSIITNQVDFVPAIATRHIPIYLPVPTIKDDEGNDITDDSAKNVGDKNGISRVEIVISRGISGVNTTTIARGTISLTDRQTRLWPMPTGGYVTGVYNITYNYVYEGISTSHSLGNIRIEDKSPAQIANIDYGNPTVIGGTPTASNVRFGQETQLPRVEILDQNKIINTATGATTIYTEIDVFHTGSSGDEVVSEVVKDFKWTPKEPGNYRFVYRIYDAFVLDGYTGAAELSTLTDSIVPIFRGTVFGEIRNINDIHGPELKLVAAYAAGDKPTTKEEFDALEDATNFLPSDRKVMIGETFTIPAMVAWDWGTETKASYSNSYVAELWYFDENLDTSSKWARVNNFDYGHLNGITAFVFDGTNTAFSGITVLNNEEGFYRQWRFTFYATDWTGLNRSATRNIEFEVVKEYGTGLVGDENSEIARYLAAPVIGVNNDSTEIRLNKSVFNVGEVVSFPVISATSRNTITANLDYSYAWATLSQNDVPFRAKGGEESEEDYNIAKRQNWHYAVVSEKSIWSTEGVEVKNGSVFITITEEMMAENDGAPDQNKLFKDVYIKATARDWFGISVIDNIRNALGEKIIDQRFSVINPIHDAAPASINVTNWETKTASVQEQYTNIKIPSVLIFDANLSHVSINGVSKKGTPITGINTPALTGVSEDDTYGFDGVFNGTDATEFTTPGTFGTFATDGSICDMTDTREWKDGLVGGIVENGRDNRLQFYAYEAGDHTFTYVATDVAGNVSIFVGTISVEGKEPPSFFIDYRAEHTKAEVGQAIPLANVVLTSFGETGSRFVGGKVYSAADEVIAFVDIRAESKSGGNGVIDINANQFWANRVGLYSIIYKAYNISGAGTNVAVEQSYQVEVVDSNANIQIEIDMRYTRAGFLPLNNTSSEIYVSNEDLAEIWNKPGDENVFIPFKLPNASAKRVGAEQLNIIDQPEVVIDVRFTNNDTNNSNREIMNTKYVSESDMFDAGGGVKYYTLTPNGKFGYENSEIPDGTYTITYTATSQLPGSKTSNTKVFTVKMGDWTDPTITVDTTKIDLPKTIKIGAKFEIDWNSAGIIIADDSETYNADTNPEGYRLDKTNTSVFNIVITNSSGGTLTPASDSGGEKPYTRVYTVEEAGTHTIRFTVTDRAGNSSSEHITFIVEGSETSKTLTATEIWGIVLIVISSFALLGVIYYFWRTRKVTFRGGSKDKEAITAAASAEKVSDKK